MKNFYIIGDSHSVIWEGNDVLARSSFSAFKYVSAFHLPDPLAWNLMNSDLSGFGKWGDAIFSIIKDNEINQFNTSCIMLSFGEIDIRTQVIKRAKLQNISISTAVDYIVNRLVLFSELLYLKTNIPLLLWEPVATQSEGVTNPKFPTVGSEFERNYATKIFQIRVREAVKKLQTTGHKIFSFGIYDEVSVFYKTRKFFLMMDAI